MLLRGGLVGMRKAAKIVRNLSSFCEAVAKQVCAALMMVLVAVVSTGVVFRYCLLSPLPWVDQLSRFLLVWIVFIAAGVALRAGEHVGVEALVRLLPRKACLCVSFFNRVVIFLFLVRLGVDGASLARLSTNQIMPTLGISMFWTYLAVPVGSALMALYLAESVVSDLAGEYSVTSSTRLEKGSA